jgi:hypothetical protein
MGNFKPNTKSMFTQFAQEVWQLRTGIRYPERGKNYYMITLFSQGDFDFVMRGGPWVFRRNALILKPFDARVSPSEHVLDSVRVWVRFYDVPGDKQNKLWGMRYGNGLGRAMEVDVPSDDQDMHEFLRVRVELPYDRRLQTQLTTGVKGKPGAVKVYKLKYERIPLLCTHCGFLGHHKDVCEKKRRGTPSLDYEAFQLRCSPFKKFKHRAHFMPSQGQAAARRGLSFNSFGSAESRKSERPASSGAQTQQRFNLFPEQVGSPSVQDDDMPPLEDIVQNDGMQQEGPPDGFDGTEKAVGDETIQNLKAQVDAMQVDANEPRVGGHKGRGHNLEPII